MATLAVWCFDAVDGAERASVRVDELGHTGRIALYDAATVEWETDKVKPRTQQLHQLDRTAALGGAFWGMLFGLIFFVPLLGKAIGAAAGAFAGSLSDVGIDDAFITHLRNRVSPGTSALFALTSDAGPEQLEGAFPDSAELICASLTAEHEQALRKVFAE